MRTAWVLGHPTATCAEGQFSATKPRPLVARKVQLPAYAEQRRLLAPKERLGGMELTLQDQSSR
jgi:hypothetical protein